MVYSGFWVGILAVLRFVVAGNGMVKVFISYSHKDEEWKDRLEVHLQGLEQQGDIELSVWDDRKIEGGEDWYPAIMKELGEASVAICLISDAFLASDFIIKEEIPILLERREKDGMLLLPVLVEPCVWEHIQWLKGIQMLPRDGKSLAEIEEEIKQKKALSEIAGYVYKKVKDPDFQVGAAVPKWEAPERIDIERLPETGMELFGRQEELEMLEKAWDSDETRVVSLVAWGGVGKSTLVNRWLELMDRENYRGARKVFGWSFYSQGTRDRATSADAFVKSALEWFGDLKTAVSSKPPWDKAKRLAELLQNQKTLLILDGMEPLQSGYAHDKGQVKDAVMSVLLRELVKCNPGLCVITTRQEVKEIGRGADSMVQRDLAQISPEAGRAMLRDGGIGGSVAELEQATRDFGCHALAIKLLVAYLQGSPGRHIKTAYSIGDLDVPEKEKHPRRVMEAFAERFGNAGELEVLHMMGLFDRPAKAKEIKWLRRQSAISLLTERISVMDEGEWNMVISHLRLLGLLAPQSRRELEFRDNVWITHEDRKDIGALDAHPLVRTHFGLRLKEKGEESWKLGHSHLYDFLKMSAERLPETLAEMEPLFDAVGHGCQAGRYQEAYDSVYARRILRGNEYYVVRKLGAIGGWLAVLSSFFDKVWSQPVSNLKESDQAVVLSGAGAALRALGRLREAVEPMEAGLALRVEQKVWKSAAINAENLSQFYLILGEVEAAVDYGRRCVEYADKSENEFKRMTTRVQLGDGQHQSGAIGEARGLFEEAEGIQKERQAGYPLLYSLQGFYFCDLILSGGGYEEVEERARQTLEWAELGGKGSLLDVALNKVSLGRAYLLEAVSKGKSEKGKGKKTSGSLPTACRDSGKGRSGEWKAEKGSLAKAGDWLGQAVDGLRESGDQDMLAMSLVRRAEYYRYVGEYEEAWEDLGEAREIGERGEMNLFLADYHLEAARVCLAEGECEGRSAGSLPTACRDSGKGRSGDWKNKARGHWEEAKERVEKMGYHRRDPEVLLIEAEVLTLEGKKEDGKKRLEKAKARIDEMGCHRWDSEVERIKRVLRF